jgi:hypothetical protein
MGFSSDGRADRDFRFSGWCNIEESQQVGVFSLSRARCAQSARNGRARPGLNSDSELVGLELGMKHSTDEASAGDARCARGKCNGCRRYQAIQ